MLYLSRCTTRPSQRRCWLRSPHGTPTRVADRADVARPLLSGSPGKMEGHSASSASPCKGSVARTRAPMASDCDDPPGDDGRLLTWLLPLTQRGAQSAVGRRGEARGATPQDPRYSTRHSGQRSVSTSRPTLTSVLPQVHLEECCTPAARTPTQRRWNGAASTSSSGSRHGSAK